MEIDDRLIKESNQLKFIYFFCFYNLFNLDRSGSSGWSFADQTLLCGRGKSAGKRLDCVFPPLPIFQSR